MQAFTGEALQWVFFGPYYPELGTNQGLSLLLTQIRIWSKYSAALTCAMGQSFLNMEIRSSWKEREGDWCVKGTGACPKPQKRAVL